MMPGAPRFLERESVAATYVEMLKIDTVLARGTGFFVEARGWKWLITCRHNITGRHQDTGQPLSKTSALTPDRLRVYISERQLGSWQPTEVLLYDDDEAPLWYEHPELGSKADVIGLPVRGLAHDLELHPLQVDEPPIWLRRRVTAELFIVGYPVGYNPTSDGAVGVWTRGSIATEPIVDVGGMPVTLVDSRTRQGQSGSPVFLNAGSTAENGTVRVGTGESVRQLFGIYSGRVHPESDLGLVWRLTVIRDIVARAQQHPERP